MYEEQEDRFVPWGPNTDLKMLTLPVTQDEVRHLRAENKDIKAENKALKAKVKRLGTNMTALNTKSEELNEKVRELEAWKANVTGN